MAESYRSISRQARKNSAALTRIDHTQSICFDLKLRLSDKNFHSPDLADLIKLREPNGDLPVILFLKLKAAHDAILSRNGSDHESHHQPEPRRNAESALQSVGVTREPDGLVILTSQPTVVGRACSAEEMIAWFEARRLSLMPESSAGHRGIAFILPRQVQAIRIPATRHGWFHAVGHVGMVLTGINQQCELQVCQGKNPLRVQILRQSRAAASVVTVGVVIEAAGIVKQREQTYHRRITSFRRSEFQSIAFHVEPVGKTVNPVTNSVSLWHVKARGLTRFRLC